MGREPERTCVGCRGKAPKTTLLRLVRKGDDVVVDTSGHAPGRGAYLHRDRGCVEAAAKRRAFAHALRAAIRPREVSNLLRDMGVEE